MTAFPAELCFVRICFLIYFQTVQVSVQMPNNSLVILG